MIAGLIEPDKGKILFKKGIATQVCLQHDYLFNEMTVCDHIHFSQKFIGASQEQSFLIVEGLGLKHLMRKKVSELSGGDRRILSIAIAILGNPQILVLDEPSASLDQSCRIRVWETIKILQKSLTLIISTQLV